jgi:hypothetical protein
LSLVYNKFKALEADGTIDLLTDTIKVVLVGTTYSASADHNFVNPDVYQTEIGGTGYTGGYEGSGRKTLGSKVVTEDDTNDRAEFSAAPVTWTSINAGTIGGAVIIRERAATGDTMSELIAFIDTGGFPVVTNGGDFTITWNAEGILQLS